MHPIRVIQKDVNPTFVWQEVTQLQFEVLGDFSLLKPCETCFHMVQVSIAYLDRVHRALSQKRRSHWQCMVGLLSAQQVTSIFRTFSG